MGGSSYSVSRSHSTRIAASTFTNTIDQNFKQNVERKAHVEMRSQGIKLREARDSEIHPNSFPVIIALDLTGSMQNIPQNLIQTGLPTIVSESIQGGVQSPAILFLGIGDHEMDKAPLQIGQFESGDLELDLWLSRTYIEQGGGGNMGESYGLAHMFAARHCATDHFDKRGQKGLLITIGDEPSLGSYPTRAIKEIMGPGQYEGFTMDEIVNEAREKWDVYHINPRDQGVDDFRKTRSYWMNSFGQSYIGTDSYTKIPKLITDLIVLHGKAGAEADVPDPNSSAGSPLPQPDVTSGDSPEEVL
jgi:hypothetical protein